MAKRKYNVGHLVPERWVFGLYDVHQKLGVLEFVDDRTQANFSQKLKFLVSFLQNSIFLPIF